MSESGLEEGKRPPEGESADGLVRGKAGIDSGPPLAAHRLKGFLLFAVGLTGAFGLSLVSLFRYGLGEELHSHIILVPVVTAYLLRINWGELPKAYRSSPVGAAVLFLLGLGALGWCLWGNELSVNDRHALVATSYLCLLVGGGFAFLGAPWMKGAVFPVFFLVFMIPLPDLVVNWMEQSLQVASAEAADFFFGLTGTPAYREGKVFQLPGMVIRVAQECSGIRSSWVLLITAFLASYMFLKTPWRRAVLVLVIVPLGILRNGFRVLVIGLLCVHYGPHMIDSPIHHKGGPIFFALSLVPLFILVWWLRRGERAPSEEGSAPDELPEDPAALPTEVE